MRHSNLIFLMLLLSVWLGSSPVEAQKYADHSVLSSGRWVRIQVDEAGVYQLSHSTLRSWGFSNPDRVRLYGLNLEVLPETQIENIDDDLVELPLYRTADRCLFYGRGTTRWTLTSSTPSRCGFGHFNNPYTQNVSYFLTDSGEGAPKEFEKYAYEVASSATQQTTFPEHALVESDGFSFMRSGRRFFEEYDFSNGKTRTYTLATPGIVGETTDLNLGVQFASGGSNTSLTIKFNGEQVGKLSFGTLEEFMYGMMRFGGYTVTAPTSETSTVTLTHERPSGIAGHLDYIRASYIRRLDMQGATSLLFRPASSGDVVFQLTGGTAETVFWHVTQASGIEEVAGTYDAGTATWRVPFSSATSSTNAWMKEELLAVNPTATYPTPTKLGDVANQDLHAAKDIDLIIVVPNSGRLTAQAERLANAHNQHDGTRSLVLPAQTIYNEFSSGTPDQTAIRRFAKMLYDRADSEENRPKNILLFGPCVWDNRMVTSNMRHGNPDDYLLAYESDTSLSDKYSYIMEEYVAMTDDNASGNPLRWKPRLGVGRIPAHTAKQAKDVVDKLITYINNEEVGNWKNLICVMADDGNENLHMRDASTVIDDITTSSPDLRIRRIYFDTYPIEVTSTGASYPAATSDIYKQMQEGALVMNYTGHGAAYCLSHEMVMKTADFATWNSPRLPLWVTAACDVAPFDMNEENIGETAILNPSGAAMGILTTTRTVIADSNRELNRRFMSLALNTDNTNSRPLTIGQALSTTKCQLIDANSNSVNKAHFVLLGDPAIRLALPTYKIVIDRINETYAPGTPYTANAGSLLTIEGHITDPEGNLADTFNGQIYPLVQDNLETVVCNNNAGDVDTPYTYTDRLRTLYTCADVVTDGKFKFTFPIPLDNNYSGQEGLISLYAATTDATIEANGRFTNFSVGGTSSELSTDTQGPDVEMYLNTESFRDGDVVNETPLLIVRLHDDSGLNMTGSGVGHDITASIDNQEARTYSLNSYFTPTVGDYRKGSLQFPIPTLPEGQHTLTLRAYDILNNPSLSTIQFYVNEGASPNIADLRIESTTSGITTFTFVTDRPQTNLGIDLKVYDVTGRRVWQSSQSGFSIGTSYSFTWDMNEADNHLTSGIYIVHADVSSNGGQSDDIAKKFVLINKK